MCIEKNVEKMSSAVFQLLIKRCFVLVLSASSAWEWPCWEGKWFLLIAVSVVVGLLKIEAVPRCWAFPACGINQIAITQGIHVPRPVPRTGPEERRNVEEKMAMLWAGYYFIPLSSLKRPMWLKVSHSSWGITPHIFPSSRNSSC